KTTITNKLVSTLSGAPHNLRVISFSMDDLYLSYKEQEKLRDTYPSNKLIEFRGLPGTHDLNLGSSTFRALCDANLDWRQKSESEDSNMNERPMVAQPSYDKAAYSGRGDQVPKDQWKVEQGPFDVVLFEGWSLGFKSIRDPAQLKEIYNNAKAKGLYLAQHSFESVEWVNNTLRQYERDWYDYMDVFVHLSAPDLTTIFKWRTEQEKDLWAKKGTGMSDEEVQDFVKRFMPAYELYLQRLKDENVFANHNNNTNNDEDDEDFSLAAKEEDGENKGKNVVSSVSSLPFRGRHLRVDLDQDREMVSTVLVE
ncbi:hypothetical protein BG004_004349, partial [Podila humilis]